jgi:hypothetical protein
MACPDSLFRLRVVDDADYAVAGILELHSFSGSALEAKARVALKNSGNVPSKIASLIRLMMSR